MLKLHGGLENVAVLPNFVTDWHRGEPHDVAEHSFFLYVGALERNKGISELISHFLSDGYYADKVLKVVGSGSQERMLRRQLGASESPDRVRLIGSQPREELFTLYDEAAALVLPSRSPENSPLACLEALCGGTPVVGTRIGGIPEIVSLISEKLLFDPGDFQTMKGILQTLLEDPPERSSIHQIYKKHFSPDSYIKGLWRLIS
jgi:glycosyltransferase involved in cell wall biosynthesis